MGNELDGKGVVETDELLKDPKIANLLAAKLKEKDDEFAKKIEEAKKETAKTEKNKLYNTISSLEEEMKAIKQSRIDEENKRKAEVEAKVKEEEEKKRAAQPLEERLKMMEAEMLKMKDESNAIKLKASELVDKTLNMTKEELRKKDIEIYKKDKISTFSGEIIPELVNGNTVEEVDASVEYAKKRYAELIAKQNDQVEKNKLAGGKVPSESKDKVLNSSGTAGNVDIWALDAKDFAAHADMLIQGLLNK